MDCTDIDPLGPWDSQKDSMKQNLTEYHMRKALLQKQYCQSRNVQFIRTAERENSDSGSTFTGQLPHLQSSLLGDPILQEMST